MVEPIGSFGLTFGLRETEPMVYALVYSATFGLFFGLDLNQRSIICQAKIIKRSVFVRVCVKVSSMDDLSPMQRGVWRVSQVRAPIFAVILTEDQRFCVICVDRSNELDLLLAV